jgi:hypothetical protein
MNLLQRVTLSLAFMASFASCQSSADPKQTLSDTASRKAIMETIANDASMSKEMLQAMMDRMQEMNGNKMDMKKMEGMNHKM